MRPTSGAGEDHLYGGVDEPQMELSPVTDQVDHHLSDQVAERTDQAVSVLQSTSASNAAAAR